MLYSMASGSKSGLDGETVIVNERDAVPSASLSESNGENHIS